MIQIASKNISARSIWISDIHLGSCGTQIKKLTSFLENISCETLFLNGDIFDKWLIKNNQLIKIKYNNILTQFNDLEKKGIKLIFLPGNHDRVDDIKKFLIHAEFKDELTYTTKQNKKYLIFHGDKLDSSVSIRMNWMSKLGTYFYELLLYYKSKSSTTNSFSRKVKITIKNIIAKLSKYEKKLIKYLKEKNVDGVICGHSHQPTIKKINSKDYFNSGDWIDNCTCLIEDNNGKISLLRWNISAKI